MEIICQQAFIQGGESTQGEMKRVTMLYPDQDHSKPSPPPGTIMMSKLFDLFSQSKT
jgi:hypothetical protein